MSSPAAEVEIDADLVAALVGDQFPDLAGPVAIVANGWDNVIARLGGDLCVRLPRRALSAPLVQHEADWLPSLAPTLPVPVPAPVRVGEPSDAYPWTWLVCPWFEGRPLSEVPVARRRTVAAELGAFVAALHRPAPESAPRSPWRGTPVADLAPRVEERLERLSPSEADVLGRAWARCLAAPVHTGPACWVHGDLHPLNVLADHAERPAVAAVVDWGDLTQGDPASDLAALWLAFDESGRAAFREAAAQRHPPDDPVWDRAEAWAVGFAALFLVDTEPGSALRAIGEHVVTQLRTSGC